MFWNTLGHQDFKQIISLDQRSKNSLWAFVKLVFEFNNNSGFGFIKFHSIYLEIPLKVLKQIKMEPFLIF